MKKIIDSLYRKTGLGSSLIIFIIPCFISWISWKKDERVEQLQKTGKLVNVEVISKSQTKHNDYLDFYYLNRKYNLIKVTWELYKTSMAGDKVELLYSPYYDDFLDPNQKSNPEYYLTYFFMFLSVYGLIGILYNLLYEKDTQRRWKK